jgi:hypothetical protein
MQRDVTSRGGEPVPDLSAIPLFGCLLPFALVLVVAVPFGARKEYRRYLGQSPTLRTRARVLSALTVTSLEALGIGMLLLVATSQPIDLGGMAPWLYWLTPSVLILGAMLNLAQRLLEV